MLKGKISYAIRVWRYYGLYRQCIFLTLGVVALIGLACLSAQAQGHRSIGSPNNVDDQMVVLTERLQLSPEQEAKVRPVIEQCCEKRHGLFQQYRWKGKDARKDLLNDLRVLDAKVRNQLEPILTADQMKAYVKLREEERAAMREQMRNRRGRPF